MTTFWSHGRDREGGRGDDRGDERDRHDAAVRPPQRRQSAEPPAGLGPEGLGLARLGAARGRGVRPRAVAARPVPGGTFGNRFHLRREL